MQLTIRKATNAEWDAFAEGDDGATFFHTRRWYEFAERCFGLKPTPRAIVAEGRVVAVLPIARERPFGLAKYTSSPLGTYGGVLRVGDLNDRIVAFAARYLDSLSSMTLRDNPYSYVLKAYNGWTANDVTHVIDLDASWDALRSEMNKAQIPRKVRQATRAGLRVVSVEKSELLRYYQIYLDCQRRWGSNTTNNYSFEVFRNLSDVPGCEFWGVVSAAGVLVCAGPFLRHGNHVVSWLALAENDSLKMRPYELLYYSLIKHYKDKGCKWFDFNPSGGHKGVASFKEGFGGRVMSSNILRKTSPMLRGMRLSIKVARRVKARVSSLLS